MPNSGRGFDSVSVGKWDVLGWYFYTFSSADRVAASMRSERIPAACIKLHGTVDFKEA